MNRRTFLKRLLCTGIAWAGSAACKSFQDVMPSLSIPETESVPLLHVPTRAIWVQGPAAQTREAADSMLDQVSSGGFNTILYCIGSGIVTYRSELLDHSRFITSDYEPLAYIVEQAHARGFQVQAWFCPGAIMRYGTLVNQHPEWDIAFVDGVPDDLHWLNFAHPDAQQFVLDALTEVIQGYDVDGIHLDYIRYPEEGLDKIFDKKTVPTMVQRIYKLIKTLSSETLLTAAVLSDQRASRAFLQNWALWLSESTVDNVMPMAYHARNDQLKSNIREWRRLAHSDRIIPGLATVLEFEQGQPKTPDEFISQIKMCRDGGWNSVSIFDQTLITTELLQALNILFTAS